MKTFSKIVCLRVFPCLFLLFSLLGFTEINIGMNNQVNTGTITGGNCLHGNGAVKEESRNVGSFEEISVDGIFEVSVISGKKQKVVIKADSNLHSRITTTVKNKKIIISSKGAICTQNPMIVEITLAELKSISLEGSSEIFVVSNNCTSEKFSVDLGGTSSMKLTGRCKNLDVQLQGTAELDGSEFEAQNVNIKAEDATEALIYVTEKLSGTSSGASEVFYSGSPEKVEVQSSDVSEISPSL